MNCFLFLWLLLLPATQDQSSATKTTIANLDQSLEFQDFLALDTAVKSVNLAHDGKGATEVLRIRLKDPDQAVRRRAAYALSQINLEEAQKTLPAIIDALRDAEPNVRARVALALAQMGPAGRAAIPALCEMLHDLEPRARAGAARALGAMGVEAKAAIPKLTELLKDSEPPVRTMAAMALGQLGSQARAAAPALRTAQAADADASVRAAAAAALIEIDPSPQALVDALATSDSIRRLWAVSALAEKGAEARESLPSLREVMRKDEDERVRAGAAFALGRIGPAAGSAGPQIVEALHDKAPRVRTAAALALGLIHPQSPEVGRALAETLKDEDAEVAGAAATALGNLGPAAEAAVPLLIDLVKQDSLVLRGRAVNVLARIGPPAQAATGVLLDVFKGSDADLRFQAARALTSAGPQATAHLPALLEAVRCSRDDRHVRAWACLSLGRIGPQAAEAVPVLIAALQDEDATVQAAASLALGEIGPHAVPALVKALDHLDPKVRAGAALALGGAGIGGRRALMQLCQALRDEDLAVSLAAAVALGRIAGEIQLAQETKAAADLEEVHKALQSAKRGRLTRDQENAWTGSVEQVRTALRSLRTVEHARVLDRLFHSPWFSWLAGVVLYFALAFAFCLLLLWLHPLLLLHINDVLRRFPHVGLPGTMVGMQLSLRALLLVGFFNYHRRVLDAWVALHFEAYRESYQRRRIVMDHGVYVPLPMLFDGKVVPSPAAKEFGELFEGKRGCLLLSGESGSGRTTLACQIGLWAMAANPAERLCKHRMLPVLIEHELDCNVAEGKPAFVALTEAVRGQLQALIGGGCALSEELLDNLLRQRRILVIVDQPRETGAAVCPAHADFPAHALIVTSSSEEALDDVPRSVLQLLRIDGNRLASFLDAYLVQRGKRHLIDDAEYFAACRQLSLQDGARSVTVQLAKQYVEQLIRVKERAA